MDMLRRRGDVKVTGAGRVALAGLALQVFDAVDDTVVRWAESLGASEHRYPSLIEAAVLQRAGQIVSPSEARDDTATLSPAVCYHAYPEWSGKALGESPALLTARGHCYRHEDGNHIPLERLWEFTMREIIVMGTRQQVEDVRQSLVRQVTALVDTLELDASIETATDPFFVAGDEGRRLMQQAGALKYELRLAVDAAGRTIAAASFNHHHDFFGTRFGIRLADDAPAHTGCVAFGLERWVLALFAQHGVDHHAWPNGMRAWLDAASQRAARGAGA
jgi:seryl-tRNA synthetase